MNIPVGKIIVVLIFIMATLLMVYFFVGGQATTPTPPAPESQTASTPSVDTSPPPSPKYNWEFTGLSYKVTEKCESWWKFAWQATLKNNTSHQVEFFITVNFLDKDGFIIDYDVINPSIFNPNEQRVVRGFDLIDIEIAPDVKSVEAEITAYIKD